MAALETKEELEKKKLELEIRELELPRWKRATYLGIGIPIIVAIAGLASAWYAGFFNEERQRLATEIASLTERRDDLLASFATTQQALNTAETRLTRIKTYYTGLVTTMMSVAMDTEVIKNFTIPDDASDRVMICNGNSDWARPSHYDTSLVRMQINARMVIVEVLSDMGLDEASQISRKVGQALKNSIRTIVTEMALYRYDTLEKIWKNDARGEQFDPAILDQHLNRPFYLVKTDWKAYCGERPLPFDEHRDRRISAVINSRIAVKTFLEFVALALAAEVNAMPLEDLTAD